MNPGCCDQQVGSLHGAVNAVTKEDMLLLRGDSGGTDTSLFVCSHLRKKGPIFYCDSGVISRAQPCPSSKKYCYIMCPLSVPNLLRACRSGPLIQGAHKYVFY